jgi:hypothetical protein
MDVIRSILECLVGTSSSLEYNEITLATYNAEKEEHLAHDIVTILFTAEKPDNEIKAQLSSIMHTEGWTGRLAKRILNNLVTALNTGRAMGHTMKEAFDKASKAAEEFAEKHPVYTAVIVTVVAIGILVLLVPWVVEALGFAELGPVEGECEYIMPLKMWICGCDLD